MLIADLSSDLWRNSLAWLMNQVIGLDDRGNLVDWDRSSCLELDLIDKDGKPTWRVKVERQAPELLEVDAELFVQRNLYLLPSSRHTVRQILSDIADRHRIFFRDPDIVRQFDFEPKDHITLCEEL